MKRDMSLIRDLLIFLEKQPAGEVTMTVEVPNGTDGATVGEHVQLLIDRDLVDGEVVSIAEPSFMIYRLTWDGHDFLQAITNDTVWKKILAKAKELGGSMTIEIAKELGKKYLMEMAGISNPIG